MTRPVRPPAAYIHGGDGPGVFVPGRIAAVLTQRARLNDLRLTLRGLDPEVDAVLEAIVLTAVEWRRSRGVGAVNGTELEKRISGPSGSFLTTADAAELLDMSVTGVRKAVRDGRLPAVRVADVWLIDREDVEHFRSTRSNGGTE